MIEEAKVFKKREPWFCLYVEDMKIEEGDIHFLYRQSDATQTSPRPNNTSP